MIEYSKSLGIYDKNIPWIPTLSHVFRRKAILDLCNSLEPGKLIEFGCGAGSLLYDMHLRGYEGKGIDLSETSITIAKQFHNFHSTNFHFFHSSEENDTGQYSYLLAVEVLEHIENDVDTLKFWKNHLKPEGQAILTVPAHRSHWGASDEWAGHVRRYDQNDVINMVNQAGMEVQKIISYGFPVMTLTRPVRNFFNARKLKKRDNNGIQESKMDRTIRSGEDRQLEAYFFKAYEGTFGKAMLDLAMKLQELTYSTKLGEGFAVLAKNS